MPALRNAGTFSASANGRGTTGPGVHGDDDKLSVKGKYVEAIDGNFGLTPAGCHCLEERLAKEVPSIFRPLTI